MTTTEFFRDRERYNTTRISDISKLSSQIKEFAKYPTLSVYLTGSYARLEASENSDLDIFFVHDGDPISKIDGIQIDSQLINFTRFLGFPEFSGDGKYLVRHDIKDILDNLGGDLDEYHNYFTARLLYLLESRPVTNTHFYDQMLAKIVDRYYTDFHDHTGDFKPIFLANDIMRFWKTLTINYEHRRNRMPDDRKPKAHLENLKLKFSRKLICFSFLLELIARQEVVNQKEIIEIVSLTPIQRLLHLQGTHPKHKNHIEAILDLYRWFLTATGYPKEEVLKWISIKSERESAFQKSREYGELLYQLLQKLDEDNGHRFLKFLII